MRGHNSNYIMSKLYLLKPSGLLFFLLAVIVLIPGCKENDSVIVVSDVKLDKSALELTIGETYQLVATVVPDDADNKTVTWSSEDIDVASVDEDGLVTAISQGETTITAMAGDKKDICKVSVEDPIMFQMPELYEGIGDSYEKVNEYETINFGSIGGEIVDMGMGMYFTTYERQTNIDFGKNTEYLFANEQLVYSMIVVNEDKFNIYFDDENNLRQEYIDWLVAEMDFNYLGLDEDSYHKFEIPEVTNYIFVVSLADNPSEGTEIEGIFMYLAR